MTVKNSLTGETFVDEANIVISARGTLNDYKWPDIPGLEDFQGTLMHSAAWDSQYVPQLRNQTMRVRS